MKAYSTHHTLLKRFAIDKQMFNVKRSKEHPNIAIPFWLSDELFEYPQVDCLNGVKLGYISLYEMPNRDTFFKLVFVVEVKEGGKYPDKFDIKFTCHYDNEEKCIVDVDYQDKEFHEWANDLCDKLHHKIRGKILTNRYGI